jgi:hypothetical protein
MVPIDCEAVGIVNKQSGEQQLLTHPVHPSVAVNADFVIDILMSFNDLPPPRQSARGSPSLGLSVGPTGPSRIKPRRRKDWRDEAFN